MKKKIWETERLKKNQWSRSHLKKTEEPEPLKKNPGARAGASFCRLPSPGILGGGIILAGGSTRIDGGGKIFAVAPCWIFSLTP